MEREEFRAIPADIHNHSLLSPDGFNQPMEMAERACGLGIKHFALTDHIETEKFDGWDYAGAVEKSCNVFLEIQERFRGKMEVYYGVELGQPLFDLPLAERLLAAHDYDFVLGSTHRTRTYPYLNQIPDSEEDRRRCLDEYFEEELRLAEWGKFCSLSHLTFPLRFISGDFGGHEVDMSRYDAIIDKILETIIRNGIAMEVNSSGIRKGLHVPMPSSEYIKRYFDKGWRMITVGSDAHRASDVGADIPEVIGLLKAVGFTEICVFRKKQPRFIPI
ncbi:MAG: histidinol-phosphatase HisJ family protein [Oscillospiraceae bacterium]